MCRLLNSLKEMASQPAASPAAKQLLAEAEGDYKARLQKTKQVMDNYLDKVFAQPIASEEDLDTRILDAESVVNAYMLGVQTSGAFTEMDGWLIGAQLREKQKKLVADLRRDWPKPR